MKRRIYYFVLIVILSLVAVVAQQRVADAVQEKALEEAIIGTWAFSKDGYFLGFDKEGRLCYGGSAVSVAAKRWCNQYTLEDGIVTESCMGGPEDRNCPLGGGSCKAAVSIDRDGQLRYRIIYDQCDMLPYKVVPPQQFRFTRS